MIKNNTYIYRIIYIYIKLSFNLPSFVKLNFNLKKKKLFKFSSYQRELQIRKNYEQIII